ncbi:MAG: T9SS type A sorting domain-containing protein [Crocinitomicaceae bacterium]|nr:T9SS type A sorting domain-containing protein [Crocinitomicaceae bacterium]
MIIFISALILISVITKAQTDLVERFPSTTVLSTEDATLYGKLANDERFSLVKLIKIKNLAANVNSNGNLQITLIEGEFQPEECGSFEFAPKTSRYIDDQNYYYYGNLVEGDSCDCKCQSGEIMLQTRNGRKFGYFVVDDAHFEILALNSQYSILARLNKSYFGEKEECFALSESQESKNPQKQTAKSRTNDPCPIRVLFLYTDAAEDEFTLNGLLDMMALGIAQTNDAFDNSGVDNVRLELANHRKYVGFTEDPNDIGQDIQDLLTDNNVALWRSDDLADVVCLITNGEYRNFLGISGTIPDPNTPGKFITNLGSPMSSLAYMIVEGASFNTNFTFSHELGHILGCRHQTCALFDQLGCDDGGGSEHGHGWGYRRCWLCGWKNYSTIMHQLRKNNKRLLRYSNPEINDKGLTGIVGISENAQWIRSGNGCTVADYFPAPPPPPLSANIIGSDFICQPFSEIYSAGVIGSNGSLTYEWHISTDGVTWGIPFSSSASVEIFSTNFAAGVTLFIRLKVTDQTGNSVYAFLTVLIKADSVLCFRTDEKTGHEFAISPNPTDDMLQVNIEIKEDNSKVLFRLYSLTGELLQENQNIYSRGSYSETFNLIDLPAGVYSICVHIANKYFNKLIVKL